jgi:hypothetical protein
MSVSKARSVSSLTDVPKTTTGAVGELIASADLLQRGFHVFRALSPSCPCDLLAYRLTDSPPFYRVQVRTARLDRVASGAGTLNFRLKESDAGKFDLLALVVENRDVYYVPMLPDGPECPHAIPSFQLSTLRRWGVLQGLRYQGIRPNLGQPMNWPLPARSSKASRHGRDLPESPR